MPRPSTREKLLDCAEELFGAHGIEGVSLRTINTAAGLSPAALHYHFGAKESLVEALLERRMPALMERRRVLLDELSNVTTPITTRDVLGALINPMVELLVEGGKPSLRYLRLLHRLQTDGDLDPQFVIERWPGGVDRLEPLLRKANPGLPVATLRLRLQLVIEVMLRSLAQDTLDPEDSLSGHVSALLDFCTHGFEAPIAGG
jgi:AcrR family transcriptional regulator